MRWFVITCLGSCAGLLFLAYNLSEELSRPRLTTGGLFDIGPDIHFRQLGLHLGYGLAVGASLAGFVVVRRRAALLPLAAAPGLLAVAFVAFFWPPVSTYAGHFYDFPQRPFPFAHTDIDRAWRDWSAATFPPSTLATIDHIEGIQPLALQEAIRSAGVTTEPVIDSLDNVYFYESKTAKLEASTREFSFAVLATEDDARKLLEVYDRTNYCKGDDLFRSTRFRNIVALVGSCTARPTVSIDAAERVLRRVGASSFDWRSHWLA